MKDALWRRIFNDEVTFHLRSKVNRHNVHVWGPENPHQVFKHERDCIRGNKFCSILQQKMYDPFHFAEHTVIGNISTPWFIGLCLSFMKILLIYFQPRWRSSSPWLRSAAIPSNKLPQRRMRRGTECDEMRCPWPPGRRIWPHATTSCGATRRVLCTAGYEAQDHCSSGAVIRDRLVKAWEELEYRIDACRVTREEFLRHLKCVYCILNYPFLHYTTLFYTGQDTDYPDWMSSVSPDRPVPE
jgi:hypothetical protein